MSEADRKKWDIRYKTERLVHNQAPSGLLEGVLGERDEGRALDLACGTGRNALFLAERGFEVDAVDISPAGLAQARRAAREKGLREKGQREKGQREKELTVNWIQADLEKSLPVSGSYDLIVMIRYLDLDLVSRLGGLLAPGGRLVVEVHLDAQGLGKGFAGPANPAFLAPRGALAGACAGLTVLFQSEGLVAEGDVVEALARIVCQRQ